MHRAVRQALAFGMAIASVAAFVACSVDGPAPTHTSFPSCEAIAVACHNRDVAEDGGTGEDCHVLGHLSRTEEACAAKKDECLAYCLNDASVDGGDQ